MHNGIGSLAEYQAYDIKTRNRAPVVPFLFHYSRSFLVFYIIRYIKARLSDVFFVILLKLLKNLKHFYINVEIVENICYNI